MIATHEQEELEAELEQLELKHKVISIATYYIGSILMLASTDGSCSMERKMGCGEGDRTALVYLFITLWYGDDVENQKKLEKLVEDAQRRVEVVRLAEMEAHKVQLIK